MQSDYLQIISRVTVYDLYKGHCKGVIQKPGKLCPVCFSLQKIYPSDVATLGE